MSDNKNEKKETIEELEALVIDGCWTELLPYFQSGRLLICAPDTNMLEIGAMLVLDKEEKVKKLAEIGAINPPNNESITEWNSMPDERIFHFLEIPPYCLAQVDEKGKKKRGPI